MSHEQEQTVQEIFEQLALHVEKLESREISLEDSFRLYEDSLKLIQTCNDKMDHIEKKMLRLDEEGVTSEQE
ncbi:MAG: exodeoxyribonuclease VII small subunit [Lachnospiraceae bacterium]